MGGYTGRYSAGGGGGAGASFNAWVKLTSASQLTITTGSGGSGGIVIGGVPYAGQPGYSTIVSLDYSGSPAFHIEAGGGQGGDPCAASGNPWTTQMVANGGVGGYMGPINGSISYISESGSPGQPGLVLSYQPGYEDNQSDISIAGSGGGAGGRGSSSEGPGADANTNEGGGGAGGNSQGSNNKSGGAGADGQVMVIQYKG